MNSRLRWRSLTKGMDIAGDAVDASQQPDRAVALIFVLTCEGRVRAGHGRQARSDACDCLMPGFSS
jgi:hypothetical protein